MKILQGAIVGCGYFARHHFEAWRRIEGVEIIAACDTDLRRAKEFSPSAWMDAKKMFAVHDLDFVDITTRPESHLELAQLAAGYGIPIICQKPMAVTEADASAMTCLTAPLMIHENWRWQPWYREVSRRLSAGAIGTPLSYWFRTRRRDGAGPEAYAAQPYFRQMPKLLIFETLVHHIDTARFLFADIESVYAVARKRNPSIAGEDQVHIVLRHASGVDGSVDGHRFLDPLPDGPALGEAGFEGDEGALTVSATGDVYQNGVVVWENKERQGYRGDSVRATQQHFVDCLRSGIEFETSARRYLHTFQAAEAAYRSISERREISLQVPG